MPPLLALAVWFILLVLLLRRDPASEPGVSKALWAVVAWFFFAGSRLPSQWLNGQITMSAEAFADGNPLDRTVFFGIILICLGVLASRHMSWQRVLFQNQMLIALLGFALISALWCDFPLVSFRRWVRDLGNYLVVLVVLSDQRPAQAIRTVFRRVGYFLIPLAIVLNKYFPALSRSYDPWSGAVSYSGANATKNELGAVCLVFALFFLWDALTLWDQRKKRKEMRIIAVDAAFLAMTWSLLAKAHCTTATICALLGSALLLMSNIRLFRSYPRLIKTAAPALFCIYLLLNFGLGMNAALAQSVGKDPTLTDRTKIWSFLLGMHTNPVLGVGYQSFWLGDRLETFWEDSGTGRINEAHNGYLEVYLELGMTGVVLLSAFLLTSYRKLCRSWGNPANLAALGMAIWLALVFFNMSEATFETGFLYCSALLCLVRVPVRMPIRAAAGRVEEPAEVSDQFFTVPSRVANQGGHDLWSH